MLLKHSPCSLPACPQSSPPQPAPEAALWVCSVLQLMQLRASSTIISKPAAPLLCLLTSWASFFEAVNNWTCFRNTQSWEWIGALRREIPWLSQRAMPRKGRAAVLALAVWDAEWAYVFSWWSCCLLRSALVKYNEAHVKVLIILQYIIKSQLFMSKASVCAWGQRSKWMIKLVHHVQLYSPILL